MRYGVCLPYMKRDYDRDTLLAWCRAIDAGPWDSLSCGERITGPTCDMRILLGAAAALTTRVRIVPSLYVLPMHSAVWAAKEIATLDVVSGGRALVTDFGAADSYVAEMKQAMRALVPDVAIDDVAHELPAYDLAHAALTMAAWRDAEAAAAVVRGALGREGHRV